MTESKLRQALDDLVLKVESYRKAHDLFGDADLVTGRCWDLMRRSEKRARAALEEPGEADPAALVDEVRWVVGQMRTHRHSIEAKFERLKTGANVHAVNSAKATLMGYLHRIEKKFAAFEDQGLSPVTITTAAIKYESGVIATVPRPGRHHTILHGLDGKKKHSASQGFMTSEGEFVGRMVAARTAIRAGQVDPNKIRGGKLFSEDLWTNNMDQGLGPATEPKCENPDCVDGIVPRYVMGERTIWDDPCPDCNAPSGAEGDRVIEPPDEEAIEMTESKLRQARYHSLRRTSPKDGPFLGTCVLCGTPDLPMSAAGQECPNQRALTQGEAISEAIEGRGQ